MSTRFYSSVEYSGQRRSNDADTIYYNASIINNSMADTVGNVVNPPVVFNEVRQSPIIEDTNEYMASVISLTSNGATRDLPLWIPRIQTSAVTASFIGSVLFGSPSTLIVSSLASGAITIGSTIAQAGNVLGYVVTAQLSGPSGGTGVYSITGVSGASQNINSAQLTTVTKQNNPNLTYYSITITSGINVAQVFLQFIPENSYIPPPLVPVDIQILSSEYYYSYNFQTFINMMNAALSTGLTAIGLSGEAITFDFSNASGIGTPGDVTFAFSKGGSADLSGVNLFMNTALEAMLPNFPGQYVNLDNGRTFKVDITSQTVVDNEISTQNYPGVSTWSPVETLIVTSNLLPLVNEQCPAPTYVGASSVNTLGNVVPGSFLPVLADINYKLLSSADWRQFIFFEPNAEYKMISLASSDSPIQNIDLNVFWRCRYDNQLYPLRLVAGSGLSIKIMFRRKQLGV